MPPGGKRAPTASEAAVIRWSIDQGAPGDKRLEELEISAEVEPAIEAVVGVLTRGDRRCPT